MKSQMSLPSSSATAQATSVGTQPLKTRPRLSIVLLSTGSLDVLGRAIDTILDASFCLETELVVARSCRSDEEKSKAQRLARVHGFSLEVAAASIGRGQLAELGARRATGDIVAVRDDFSASESSWLSPFAAPVEEAVVWDSGIVTEISPVTPQVKVATNRSTATPAAAMPRPLGAAHLLADSPADSRI